MGRDLASRILIVDDHEDHIELLRARLEARGLDALARQIVGHRPCAVFGQRHVDSVSARRVCVTADVDKCLFV